MLTRIRMTQRWPRAGRINFTTKQILASLCVLGLCGFVDSGKHFSIDFPQNWSTPKVVADDGTVQAESPESSAFAWCRANSIPLAALDPYSQKELNKEYAALMSEKDWADVISVDASKFSISDGVVRQVDGRIVQEVTMDFPGEPFQEPTRLRFLSWILPGRMVNAGCFASTATFEGYADEFERTVRSLRPL